MPRGKTAKTLKLLEACQDILRAIHPATVRAVCYQLFIRGFLPSMAKTCTNRVSKQLVFARENGLIPWEWIVDETREAERPGTWADPETYIPAVLDSYRRDRWIQQPVRVEVWSEKGTVRGTLAPILRHYGVTFRVMHGHASATTLYDVASESQQDPLPLVALYCGDWDPSGLHMSEVDLPARLTRYGGAVEVDRVALVGADVDPQHSTLPSFPATDKTKDARYRWFVTEYGHTCWELDALSPVVLRERLEEAIGAYIDWDVWQRFDVVERAERTSLSTFLAQWSAVKAGQATL